MRSTLAKALIFGLATAIVITLLFSTWAMLRLSSWIVSHDAVWIQMNKEGSSLEHLLAEAFFTVGSHGLLLVVESLVGMFFLALLWNSLFRVSGEKKRPGEP